MSEAAAPTPGAAVQTTTGVAKGESNSTAIEITKLGLNNLSNMNPFGILRDTLAEAGKIADKGVMVALTTAGLVLPFVALLMKFYNLEGKPISALSVREFAVVVLLAAVCFVTGTVARLFTYYCEHSLVRDTLKAKLSILQSSADITEKGLEAASDIARLNAGIAEKQIAAGAQHAKQLTDIVIPDQPPTPKPNF